MNMWDVKCIRYTNSNDKYEKSNKGCSYFLIPILKYI